WSSPPHTKMMRQGFEEPVNTAWRRLPEHNLQQTIIIDTRASTTVGVVGQQVQRPVRTLQDASQAAELSLEVHFLAGDTRELRPYQDQPPQLRPAQRGHHPAVSPRPPARHDDSRRPPAPDRPAPG